MIDAETLIKKFQLQPHPEGGLFKETYRATGAIQKTHLPDVYGGNRNYSTAIYYLLLPDTKSQFHKLKSDEIWHFYLGGSLTLVQIFEAGKIEKMVLGPNIEANEKVQHVIQANCWFCAYPNPESPYSFVGCTVAPGFDFQDFELGNHEQLLEEYPEAKRIIDPPTN